MLVKVSQCLCIIVLSVSLSSCSTFSFLFERLPWLSSWQLSNLFDLNDEQEEQVEEVAGHMKSWFIQHGFPSLVLDLSEIRDSWSEQPRADDIQRLFESLDSHVGLTLEQLAPKFAPLAVSMNADNLAHFEEYMEDKRSDWFESLESEEDKEDRRVERLEDYFGDLNDAQVEIIREYVSLLPDELAIRRENSQHWVERFVYAVRAKDEEGLREWLATPSVWWTQGYASVREQNRRQIDRVLESLVPTLSPRQAKHAQEEVQEWIDELEEVIADGNPEGS